MRHAWQSEMTARTQRARAIFLVCFVVSLSFVCERTQSAGDAIVCGGLGLSLIAPHIFSLSIFRAVLFQKAGIDPGKEFIYTFMLIFRWLLYVGLLYTSCGFARAVASLISLFLLPPLYFLIAGPCKFYMASSSAFSSRC